MSEAGYYGIPGNTIYQYRWIYLMWPVPRWRQWQNKIFNKELRRWVEKNFTQIPPHTTHTFQHIITMESIVNAVCMINWHRLNGSGGFLNWDYRRWSYSAYMPYYVKSDFAIDPR